MLGTAGTVGALALYPAPPNPALAVARARVDVMAVLRGGFRGTGVRNGALAALSSGVGMACGSLGGAEGKVSLIVGRGTTTALSIIGGVLDAFISGAEAPSGVDSILGPTTRGTAGAGGGWMTGAAVLVGAWIWPSLI